MPDGHTLGPAQRYSDALGRLVFRASCECMPPGVHFYATGLQHIWAQHHAHLLDLQAQSRRRHPSHRGPA